MTEKIKYCTCKYSDIAKGANPIRCLSCGLEFSPTGTYFCKKCGSKHRYQSKKGKKHIEFR